MAYRMGLETTMICSNSNCCVVEYLVSMEGVEKAYDKVDRAGPSYLRSACGITWRDRRMNVEVREQSGVGLDVLESVKRNTLRWFGHVECMWSERVTKKVYESEVGRGQRRRGGPREMEVRC